MRPSDGRRIYVTGASGSGKTTWTKQATADAARLLVWDVEGQWHDVAQPVEEGAELVRLLLDPDGPPRLAFVPRSLSSFDWWARVAFSAGRLPGRAPLAVVAEETADVTHPGKAPDGWGVLIRRGRKWGIDVYGLTQRPAESDKTLLGNASLVWVGHLPSSADRRYVANRIGLDPTALDLAPLEFITWYPGGPTPEEGIPRGRVTFPPSRRRNVTRGKGAPP